MFLPLVLMCRIDAEDSTAVVHTPYLALFFFFVTVYQGKEFFLVILMVLLLGTFLMMKEQAYHK